MNKNDLIKLKAQAEKSDRERRFTPGTVEVRMDGEGDDSAARIVGYGAVFGKRSVNLGGFTEIIQEGAFDDVLLDGDTRGLFNHDRNQVLGRNGVNMTLRVDSTGLEYDILPPATRAADDVVELVRTGIVDQSSFGFSVAEDGQVWEEDADTGAITRTITKVLRLFDVSPVTFPAYPDTQVAVRSLEDFITVEVEEGSKSKSKSKSGSDNSESFRMVQNDSESSDEFLARALTDHNKLFTRNEDLEGQVTDLTKTIERLSRALEIAERMAQ